ncbi:hypothetical protein [Vibrio viridaestus]|uniref:Pilus assembly protein n=1 Tax=Vibrio viridaestus TaxID=2487322 RepID=A0A3N9TGY2_9VIBR|nr:hypothetical protein [Vibrio viridaestus]RQW63023.1 hypothetical protein EES38_11955 [Vibrio viridaestus]
MKLNMIAIFMALGISGGCVSGDYQAGGYVNTLIEQQTYNPDAVRDNRDFLPQGSGERMEKAYTTYSGKSGGELNSGTESRVLEGL